MSIRLPWKKGKASPNGKLYEQSSNDRMTEQAAIDVDWRAGYDKMLKQAIVEGRSCSRCIDGVVQIKIPGEKDAQELDCNCSFAEARKARLAEEAPAS